MSAVLLKAPCQPQSPGWRRRQLMAALRRTKMAALPIPPCLALLRRDVERGRKSRWVA